MSHVRSAAGAPRLDNSLTRRRRSSGTPRRPRPESSPAAEKPDASSSSSAAAAAAASDEDAASSDGEVPRREVHLDGGPSPDRATEGVLSPANPRGLHKTKGSNQLHSEGSVGGGGGGSSSHGARVMTANHEPSTGDKTRKLKLKIGGIRRSAPAKPSPDVSDSRSLPAKPPRPGDLQQRQKHGNKAEGTKDSSRLPSSRDKKTKKEKSIEDASTPEQPAKFQREPSSDPVRKSRRLSKKPIVDSELDEDYDTNIVEDLGTSEGTEVHTREPTKKVGSSSKKNTTKKAKSRSTAYEIDNDFVSSRSIRDSKKRSRESTDVDNTEEEPASDNELDAKNRKQKSVTESPSNVRSEPLTTRRRALQSWMDGSSNSAIEFPDGLPSAPSRSKKDKLSEEEMHAKKAEAAQRRKMQVEKATKESEAEAIRKILGLDSEKKKEERKQKEREEKERAARAQTLPGNTIRWVMGPSGTVVSFPEEVGLPSIFNSKPCNYPPPREKCAGPSCTNAYRYRDSKLNLPLCSLKCYRAVHGNA
ncbi:eukaryotic translation initiation factor 5B [Oryza brachyantha]|uniref:INO80 complex subunit B-like conserved region domain-containing protein n=1 Tax=Oryza brachyantha TaxID=4533 RepID=J3NE56_ORYBR|nr:eukaryotic translation initiation factor 5B [Oryza brachyantha]XP_015698420.1 eukaryotic translation initiation factor 5B [Oryza brachyantha]XP_015698421.1 eukaryotic translation initiation factor 5B [Oryza brachyantha]XP_015698422.1 eukaryotic translation initiation factor 5B [Oryza brachyantha]